MSSSNNTNKCNNPFIVNKVESNQVPISIHSTFIRPSLLRSSFGSSYSTTVNAQENLPSASQSAYNQFNIPEIDPTPSKSTQTFRGLQMPSSETPWRCPSWMSSPSIQPGSYMTFSSHRPAPGPVKRKATSEMDAIIKSKHLKMEERMVAHLNSMHISSDFKTHSSSNEIDNNKIDTSNSYDDNQCSVQDIEEKLKNAQRITVSDMVRTIQNDPLLPASILERYEKPSKALVVWQPPPRITDFIAPRITQPPEVIEDESDDNINIEDMSNENDAQMDLDA